MSENGNLKYITTCTLCNQRFSNSALPVIGDKPDAKTRGFVEGLIFHLKRNHGPQFAEFTRNMILMADKFAAWLALQSFETGDPNLMKSQEEMRVWVHTLTRKNQLSDADLLDRVARLELAEAEAQHVQTLSKEIRDYLTEQGAYSPVH
jgi:hypothetical protein